MNREQVGQHAAGCEVVGPDGHLAVRLGDNRRNATAVRAHGRAGACIGLAGFHVTPEGCRQVQGRHPAASRRRACGEQQVAVRCMDRPEECITRGWGGPDDAHDVSVRESNERQVNLATLGVVLEERRRREMSRQRRRRRGHGRRRCGRGVAARAPSRARRGGARLRKGRRACRVLHPRRGRDDRLGRWRGASGCGRRLRLCGSGGAGSQRHDQQRGRYASQRTMRRHAAEGCHSPIRNDRGFIGPTLARARRRSGRGGETRCANSVWS